MRSHIAALGLDCRLPNKKLLTITTALTIIVFSVCGCSESHKSFQQMSGDDQMNYLRAQAESAMLVEATNAVPGIRDVIEDHADTFPESVEQWRGWVRVDYADFSGGTQRTNIPMVFLATFDGRLIGCAPSRTDSALININ